jgi:sulfoxide reductase catalytic subunit YedY
MHIKVKKGTEISENEVTSEYLYLNRRQILKAGGLIGASSLLATVPDLAFGKDLAVKANAAYKVEDKDRSITKEDLATSYNNFYEFSLDKGEVRKAVDSWKLADNWQVEVTGLTEKKQIYNVEDLIKMAGGIEERIYRFRCVEAWSMVIPWDGFPLQQLIAKLKPKASAKYVVFQSFSDRKIGANMGLLPNYPWPYTEGLTMEEALHPLSFMATGMYGKSLPKQNGAPIRLVTPWKYGFKSIKSIVRIEFSDKQPKTLWNDLAPSEYGFYANVNPQVDHPRWSQSSERVINGKFIPSRIPTLMFNGYEKEVAGLYKGLDLKKLI